VGGKGLALIVSEGDPSPFGANRMSLLLHDMLHKKQVRGCSGGCAHAACPCTVHARWQVALQEACAMCSWSTHTAVLNRVLRLDVCELAAGVLMLVTPDSGV
jgi:hypothetical protein